MAGARGQACGDALRKGRVDFAAMQHKAEGVQVGGGRVCCEQDAGWGLFGGHMISKHAREL